MVKILLLIVLFGMKEEMKKIKRDHKAGFIKVKSFIKGFLYSIFKYLFRLFLKENYSKKTILEYCKGIHLKVEPFRQKIGCIF